MTHLLGGVVLTHYPTLLKKKRRINGADSVKKCVSVSCEGARDAIVVPDRLSSGKTPTSLHMIITKDWGR